MTAMALLLFAVGAVLYLVGLALDYAPFAYASMALCGASIVLWYLTVPATA